MKIIKFLLFLIGILILFFGGILIFTKTNLKVNKAEFNNNYGKIYPPNCFVQFENKKYLVLEVYKYKNKFLKEFWFVASEGFAVQKFEFPFEINYANEQKPYIFLNYSEKNDSIKFNSIKYKISEKRGDTIISKIDKTKIILFIDD
jgi:hypothetical protein